MSKKTYLTLFAVLASLVAAPVSFAQEPAAEAVNVDDKPKVKTADDLKWDADLVWISFIVDDGRVQSNRDYFGAVTKADFNSITTGSAKGMVKVQQVFYYNVATRQFSRFDASSGNAIPILKKSGYFRPESIMRMVPLNKQFVENLAVREFLSVEGVED